MGAMQTRVIAVIVLVIILFGAGGYLLYSRNHNSAPTQQANTTASTTPSASPSTGGQTLADLFAMGGNKKCTFSVNGSTGGSTKGTMYVSGTNVYGDIAMTDSNGKVQNTHIIRLGDENYIWGDALPTGIKMKLSVKDFSSNTQTSQAFNPSQKTNFDCSDWSVEQSKFTPPTNIKFTDMSSFMAPSGTPSTSSAANPNSAQCAACNSLTGAAKATCLSSLNCQ
jgi:hypothetical protein